ncbi:MAG: HAMP domain-containing protein [Candidatus Edwardsbacteria bacterium]
MQFRRKNYLTKKRYQFRMLGLIAAIVFFATAVSILATHYFMWQSIVKIVFETGKYPPVWELMRATNRPLYIVIPIVFVFLAILVIFISHRIAGPIYRLKQSMEKVGEGDFSVRLKFRKTDEIQDVADSFNKMVERLEEKEKGEGRGEKKR